MNKIYNSVIIFLVLMISYHNTEAQISSLNATMESLEIIIEDEHISLQSSISIDQNTLIWTQHLSNLSEEFDIVSKTGQWDNTQNIGELIYLISEGDLSGEFKLYNQGENIFGELSIVNGASVKIIFTQITYQ